MDISGAVLVAICTLCFCLIAQRLRKIIQIKDSENQNLKAENGRIRRKKDNATSHLKAKVKIEREMEDEISQLTANLDSCKKENQTLRRKMWVTTTDMQSQIFHLEERSTALEIHLSRLGGYRPLNLDELIEQREKEKRDALQESLMNKLKSIYNRRESGVNLKPFPEDAFERLKAHHIWEKVFGYLTGPWELTSATFTNQTFTDILDGRRKLLLLPEVIKVFRNRADEAFEDENPKLGNAWCRDWKLICFNARSVCRDWKEIADFSLFDSDFSNGDWFLSNDLLQKFDPTRNISSLKDEDSMDQLLSLLTHAEPPCPLIRNLQVSIQSLETNDAFLKFMELLRTHGKAVWFFQLKWDGSRGFDEIYVKLTQILTFLPNLKGLNMNTSSYDYFAIDEPENRLRIINENLFPVLDSLEHLYYSFNDSDLLLRILRRCVNLKSVVVQEGSSYEYSYTEELTEAFLGLTLERYEGILAPILQTGRVQWPLKHLTVDVELENARPVEVFAGINCFQETLQQLWINECIKTGSAVVRLLHFPNLKVLAISRGDRKGIEVDNLLQFKSLEKMLVGFIEDEDENSNVKILGHFKSREMDKSNIWKCFSNLIRFNLCGRGFRHPSHTSHSFYHRIPYLK